MKVLFAKCFGLGNAVMAIPAIKALRSLGHQVDVLVGNTPDDVGAFDVLTLAKTYHGLIGTIWVNSAPLPERYDLAILSIPFDGRWKNGVHFSAQEIMDGRTRPIPSTTGLVSWKKHEVEYQLDNIRELGFTGDVPDCSFLGEYDKIKRDISVYLGVGYKKDSAGFWKVKHWGNQNYSLLLMRLFEDTSIRVICTGDTADLQFSIKPIRDIVGKRLEYVPTGLRASLDVVQQCDIYIGNDTGMAHVAAACGRKVITVHNLENSIVKSHPWCDVKNRIELDGSKEPVSVSAFYDAFRSFYP